MKHTVYFSVYTAFLLYVLAAAGCKDKVDPPQVSNIGSFPCSENPATNICIGFTIKGKSLTECGIFLGIGGDIANASRESIVAGEGDFFYTFKGLRPSTRYSMWVFAENDGGRTISAPYVKKTASEHEASPQVSFGNTTHTHNSITLTGNITTPRGTIVEKGFYYSTSYSGASATKVQAGSGTSSFTKTITGLQSATTYYVWVYAKNEMGEGKSSYYNITTGSNADYVPVVTIPSTPTKTNNSITIAGNITTPRGTITEKGFYYNTSSSPTGATKVQADSGTSSFTKTITGLQPATTYYVWAYAINDAGAGTSGYSVVTTMSNANYVPVVTILGAPDKTYNSITLVGNVTDARGSTITDKGFYYNTTASLEGAQKISKNGGEGSFSHTIEGLLASTTYYVWVYAQNEVGEGKSNYQYVTTRAISEYYPSISGYLTKGYTSAASVRIYNVSVTDQSGFPTTQKGVCYNTTGDPTTADNKITSTSNTINLTISGLDPTQMYYFRAYASNSLGTSYSSVVSGRYLTFSSVSIGVSSGTQITFSASVSLASGASITEFGLCYSNSNSAPTTSDQKQPASNYYYSVTLSPPALQSGGRYWVRPYVIVGGATYYGTGTSHSY